MLFDDTWFDALRRHVSIPFLHIADLPSIHLSPFCPGPSTPILLAQLQ
jgi:hypothetical protein